MFRAAPELMRSMPRLLAPIQSTDIVRTKFDHFAQPLAPLGVAVAAGSAPQGAALACEGLFQGDARPFGRSHHLTGNLQQERVHRVSNRLFLNGGVHDHALELGWLDRLAVHRSVDDGLQEFFDVGLAQGRAEAPDLGGVSGQARLVEGHPAEGLPDHVLGPRFANS